MADQTRPLDLTFRQLVICAMLRGDHDGIKIRLNTDLSDDGATVLDCVVESEEFRLLVPGWKPTPRISVLELFTDLETLYNSDPTADDVAHMLQDRKQVRTLLTDFAQCREASEDLKSEQAKRDAILTRYTELLKLPTSWRGMFSEKRRLGLWVPIKPEVEE